jgi:plastocyanin
MSYKITQPIFMASLFLILLFTSCKKEDNDNGHGNHNGKTATVSITNFSYSPSTLTIKSGVTVTWTNNDDAPHTVTANDNSFTSGTLNKGDTYSRTFTSTGTIGYFCKFHPSMVASVVVQ